MLVKKASSNINSLLIQLSFIALPYEGKL